MQYRTNRANGKSFKRADVDAYRMVYRSVASWVVVDVATL